MSSQELLETYGKAASIVKDFYLGKFLESMESEALPENFKEFAKEQGIDNDTVAQMIDSMPRALFDAFDAHEIYITTSVAPVDGLFIWHVQTYKETFDGIEYLDNRISAEKAAIEKAFEILNEKL